MINKICRECGLRHGDKRPNGFHTVALGNCPVCGSKGHLWPMRHFFTPKAQNNLTMK